LSLASGVSASHVDRAAEGPTPNSEASREITLIEEEIADVSLATFHIFDKEAAERSGRARVPLRAEVVEVAAGRAAGIAAEIHPVEGGVVVATEACRQ